MAVQQSTLIITVNAQQARRDIERLDRSLVDLERSGTRSTTALGRSVSSLTGYMAGLLSVGTAISKMDAYTNLQNRLKLVTESQQELNKATKDTFEIAQKTAQAWDSVVQVYQRFSDNAKTLGLDMQRVAGLTETVAKSISISGASAASAEAALVQFGQALASGVLRGEEFNSIAEQAPALLKAIANGLGVNIGQLRSMAAEGKLTGDVVVQALEKSKESVDDLFAKTDFTVANSFTQLNNALTQFVGEAGKANGAASFLSTTIKSLADNLGAIANVAVLGGVALLTKAIATQAIAVKKAIGESMARRAALTAESESVVRLATIETQRIRAQVGALASEQNLIVARLRSNVTLQERIVLEARATQVAIQLAVAERNLTAATVAQTAAQNALNTSRTVGARVFAALGGGVGVLTIAVTALAAGYMYMKHRAEEANKKLEEQMEIASKTREELLALKGVQKDVAVNDLKDAFEKQNEKLHKLNLTYNGFIRTVKDANEGNREVKEISDQVHKGLMSQAEALERLNKLNILTPEQKKQGLDLVNNYILQTQETLKAEKALNVFGVTVKLTGNAAENAAQKVNLDTDAKRANREETERATKAQQEYIESLRKTAFQAGLVNELISRGYGVDRAKALADAYVKSGNTINKETIKLVDQNIAENEKLKASENALTAAKKDGAKVEKDAAKQREKYAKDAIKFAEEQAEVMYRYGSDETKRSVDLQKEIANLEKYGLTQYVAIAKTRYEEEKKLAKMNFEYDLVEFRLSEEKKIRYRANIREQEIIADTRLTKEQTEQKLAALKIETAQQLYDARLAQKQRIFNAEEFQYTEMERIKKRYELEREEIGKTHDVVERNALLQASFQKQNKEEADVKDQAISDYASVMGFEENPLIKQFEALDKMRELDLINEQAYQDAKLQIQMKSTAAYLDGMLGGFAALVDQNSKTYAVLFAAQKAFAVAQAVLNIPAAYSKAYDAVVGTPFVGPYIAPAIGAAAAALQVAQAAKIKGTQMAGFESGGYTGDMGTKTVAGVVHGQEYVFNAKATKKIGVNNLEQMSKTGELPQAQPTTNIINVFDESELRSAMATPAGEKIILNVIKRNRSSLGI